MLAREISKYGAALVKALIPRDRACDIDRRLRANLARLSSVFPDYELDANKTVFPVSVAMADPAEPTLPGRLAEAMRGNILDPQYVSATELAYFLDTIRPLSELAAGVGPYVLRGLDNCYARFEKARAKSDFETRTIHQDAVFDLHGLTVWVALSPCGRDAPALQYVRRKYDKLLPRNPSTFTTRRGFRFWKWERPEYEPGDAVIFDSYTVHGTYIIPTMTASRTSLDVRFISTRGAATAAASAG